MTRPPARRAGADEAYARDAVTVLGLPFDVIDVAGAVAAVRAAAFENRRCFVSTPNLNFAVAAARDPAFRRSVLQSDLVLADGMPIVALARLDGSPLPERVAGATLFEALRRAPGIPVDVYLFGGQPGAAAAAAARLNAEGGGVRCVGFEEGGFGPVESLGDPGTIDRINASGAHFVVASLGAAKGQAWLERNATSLHAPLLCHLGAVVNFAAERLRRAPPWMQRAGLEWAWRIREEPSLWRRYAGDAAAAGRTLLPRLWTGRRRGAPLLPPWLEDQASDFGTRLRLGGDWSRDALAPLRQALADSESRPGPLTLDLSEARSLDAATVALLQISEGRRPLGDLAVTGVRGEVSRTWRFCLATATASEASV